MFRSITAALTSFLVAWLAGPRIIRWLMKKKIGDRPEFHHETLNELNKEKANTPTMGGLIVLAGVLAGTLLWAKLSNPFIQKAIILVIWFGGIGACDDWLKLTSKIRHRSRDGLKPWEKLAFQFGGAILIATFLYSDVSMIPDATRLWLPFYKHGIPISGGLFVLIAIFYISATSNAVNLTDAEAGELSIFYSAIIGASMGFLWYNCHPAQTFMGDIGSLPLGAAMGYGALVTRNEVLLLIIGGVFMLELASVILQIGYFKYTSGKRLFKCAPIHHHFHLAGWSEPQIVVRFWLLAAAFAALSLATLKIR